MARQLARIDVLPLAEKARLLAAGIAGPHAEITTIKEEAEMKGFRRATPAPAIHPRRVQDFKAKLLSETLPDLDVMQWEEDVYQVRRRGADGPVRIQMRDRGWLEIDDEARRVRTWGRVGRASDLAAAIAESRGWRVASERPVAAVAAPADHPPSRPRAADLESWWRERGYDAVAAKDGIWVDVGDGTALQDVGDRVHVHGELTDEAARAIILKAREQWDGAAELQGTWSLADMDRLWLEAQRTGVTLGRCTPSARARKAWEEESAAAAKREDTLAQVRAVTGPAQDLKDAAAGDSKAYTRLDPSLQALVDYYLDDSQRRELAGSSIEDIVPELVRFRQIGAEVAKAAEEYENRRDSEPDLDEISPIPQFRVPG